MKLDDIETKKEAELPLNEEEDEIEEMVTLIIEKPKEKWDCESILSEYLCIHICISCPFHIVTLDGIHIIIKNILYKNH